MRVRGSGLPSSGLPLLALLLVGAQCVGAVGAAAQERWVVVAAGPEAEAGARSALASEVAAVLAAKGEVVIPAAEATARVEERLGEPPPPAPEGLAWRLGEVAEALLEEVAFGRDAQVVEQGNAILAEVEPHVVVLGRHDGAATDVSNVCLFLVRALLRVGGEEEARAGLRRCLALVPDLEADERLHPPEVRDLLARERGGEESGSVVAIRASAGDHEGCAIRINGRVVGETPRVHRALPAARYAVQVECGPARPGRVVHISHGGRETSQATVPVSLAHALRTRPTLALVLDAEDDVPRVAHQLAAVVGVGRVLTLEEEGHDRVLRAFAVDGDQAAPVGSARVAPPYDQPALEAAVGQLSATVRDARPPAGGAGAIPDEGALPPVPGWLMAGAGAAGIALGWVFWDRLQARNDELAIVRASSPGFGERQDAVDGAVPPVVVASAAGGVLLTAGVSWLLPRADGVPWWAWVAGGVGLAVAGVGASFFFREGDPIDPDQTRHEQNAVLGGLLLAHAAPLLAAPLVYLLRGDGSGGEVGVGLDWRRDGAALRVGGRF